MYARIALFLLCGTAWLNGVSAQQSASAVAQDDVVDRLDAICRRMESHLTSLPAYEVSVRQQWKVDGQSRVEGVNHFTLIRRHDGPFTLKVGNQTKQDSALTCFGDGKTITRVLTFEDRCIHARKSGGLADLLHDIMTDNSLRYSGLDILCREHPDHYIMTMASEIKYVGEEQLPAGGALHFQMDWGDGDSHGMNLWFSAGDKPLLLKISSSIEFNGEQDTKHTISVTADLTWKTNGDYADDQFQVTIPDGSVEVADLFSYLADGGTIDLLGQPTPTTDVKMLDGSVWNLEKHKGKQIVVLYFFTTWAAPSKQEIPELLDAMRKHEDRGVVFYAVNVGEPADVVQTIVDSYKYTHPVVLDTQRQLAKMLQVTSLPTVVVIGRDGTIQAVHVGNTSVIRQQLQADLAQLLAGQTLVKPGD